MYREVCHFCVSTGNRNRNGVRNLSFRSFCKLLSQEGHIFHISYMFLLHRGFYILIGMSYKLYIYIYIYIYAYEIPVPRKGANRCKDLHISSLVKPLYLFYNMMVVFASLIQKLKCKNVSLITNLRLEQNITQYQCIQD